MGLVKVQEELENRTFLGMGYSVKCWNVRMRGVARVVIESIDQHNACKTATLKCRLFHNPIRIEGELYALQRRNNTLPSK